MVNLYKSVHLKTMAEATPMRTANNNEPKKILIKSRMAKKRVPGLKASL